MIVKPAVLVKAPPVGLYVGVWVAAFLHIVPFGYDNETTQVKVLVHVAASKTGTDGLATALGAVVFDNVTPVPVTLPELAIVILPLATFTEFDAFVVKVQLLAIIAAGLPVPDLVYKWFPWAPVFESNVVFVIITVELVPEEDV